MLAQALTPPDAGAVAAAVGVLAEVGALAPGEHLTPLGRHLAALPADVRVGKVTCLLLFGMCTTKDLIFPL